MKTQILKAVETFAVVVISVLLAYFMAQALFFRYQDAKTLHLEHVSKAVNAGTMTPAEALDIAMQR